MTDFSKILNKAKELESKMKESQEKIKKIKAEGVSGSNLVKVVLNGDGEMEKIEIQNEILKEDKLIIEDLQGLEGSLNFCNLAPIIAKTFKIMGLTKYCETFENEEAALEKLT